MSEFDITKFVELAKLKREHPEEYKEILANLEEVSMDFMKISIKVLKLAQKEM